jgi:RNA polymerase sigma-70 factor, ECF subfamily
MSESALQQEFERQLQPILGPAFSMALHLARDRDDAEDVVQEAALLAFRGFGSFQPGTNFKAWFFRILTNVFLHRYRKKQREPQMADIEDAPDLYLFCRTAEIGLHARCQDPAGLVMSQLTAEQVSAAIAALPDEYRVAATLYFVEEFSYQEIAEVMECPVGTIRSRLHRGRKLLQKALWRIAEEQGIIAALTAEVA